MNNTEAHQKLVDDLLFAIGSLPYARVWPQVNGLFRSLYREDKIRVGVNGMADIGGILRVPGLICKPSPAIHLPSNCFVGLRLEIECKTGSGKLSKDQINYRDMITRFGGIYIQARDVEQVLTEIKRFR